MRSCNDARRDALDDSLNTMAEIDPCQSRVVELCFFAGLSLEETSKVMGLRRRRCSATGSRLVRGCIVKSPGETWHEFGALGTD
jgi:DNA-directed RNA polymerase specialized sigma24 family protein